MTDAEAAIREAKDAKAWHPTACILCECNCGVEVQLGGPGGRRFVRVRGDEAHPASRGYACEKPSRLDYYQNGAHRLTRPLRRRPDGGFDEIDWDTAIREVAERLAAVRDAHGGETIFYYGGGGQGNHLPGAYSRATRAVLGSVYRSNALAQEKTGEFWVASKMMGGYTRADFEHCEVALFLGENQGFLPMKSATSACSTSPRTMAPSILALTQNSPVFSWASAFDRCLPAPKAASEALA